jgi:hypothetical protein
MKQLSLVLAFAAGASVCSAQSSQSPKVLTKAELALLTPPVTGTYAPSPLGGGSDDCVNAATQDAISGLGNFAVDMTISTTSPTPAPGCGVMTKDVWFEWTSTVTGPVNIGLCGHTTSDVVLAVWSGAGCPVGASLACNDDSCGLVSFLTFSATASSVYMIQVGMYNNGTGVLTSMDIGTPPPPPTNDDCSTPIALPAGTWTQSYDSTAATTGSQGQAEVLCNDFASFAVYKDLWYTWTATVGGPAELSTCGLMTLPSAAADTKIAVYDGAGCPAGAAIGCNDDAGHSLTSTIYTCNPNIRNSTVDFTAVCGQSYTFQIGQYGTTDNIAGAFSITQLGTTGCTVGTPECFGDTAALCPCSGAGGSLVPNPGSPGHGCGNTGFPGGAQLTSTGNAVDNPGDTLVLTCSGMTGPGLFIQANAAVGPFVNFNDGTLCAASGIIRMGVVFPAAGVASYPGGLTPAPIHTAGAPVLLNGNPTPATKHYQCWYRDITPGFCNTAGHNMSNGLAIVWAP